MRTSSSTIVMDVGFVALAVRRTSSTARCATCAYLFSWRSMATGWVGTTFGTPLGLIKIWPVSGNADLRDSKANQRNSQLAGTLTFFFFCQFITKTGCLIAICSDIWSAICNRGSSWVDMNVKCVEGMTSLIDSELGQRLAWLIAKSLLIDNVSIFP